MSLASGLGKAYAHIQDTMDRAIGWGFSKMKEANAEKKDEPEDNTKTGKVMKAGRQVVSFIGEAGDAYFKTYDKLKSKKKK